MAWHPHRYPETEVEHAAADLPLYAGLGRFTGYVPPAALGMAWCDWSSHLLLSPDKQIELETHACRRPSAGFNTAPGLLSRTPPARRPAGAGNALCGPGMTALALERTQPGISAPATMVAPPDPQRARHVRHHADVATYVARQLLDCVAPSNFVPINPVVL